MEELPDMRATSPTRDVLTDTTSGAMLALTGRLRAFLERHPVGHGARTGHIGAPGSLVRTKQLVSLCRRADVLRRDAVACGWVDLLNARCVLEPYETLLDGHRRRQRRLDFSRHDYLTFCAWLAAALDPMKIRIEFTPAPAPSSSETRCLRLTVRPGSRSPADAPLRAPTTVARSGTPARATERARSAVRHA